MENRNEPSHNLLWEKIYSIVSLIPRKEVGGDAVDAISATTAVEEMIRPFLLKGQHLQPTSGHAQPIKPVTDGEIKAAAKKEFGNNKYLTPKEEGFRAGAKWMREQQGEGAKEKQLWLSDYKNINQYGWSKEIELIDGPHSSHKGVREAQHILSGIGLDRGKYRNYVMVSIEKIPDGPINVNEEAIYDLAKLNKKEDEWISVKDRLPDKPGEYLVFTRIEWDNTLKATYLYGKWYDVSHDGEELIITHSVTHWMPLPNPPKGLTDKQ